MDVWERRQRSELSQEKPKMAKDKDVTELLEEEQDTFEGDELSLDDLEGNWIKNPKVGEEIVFTIKRLVKNKNTKAKDRKGKEFDKALSKVDYAVEVHTDTGAIYTITSWEVFGKIKQILKSKKQIAGVQIKVKHLKDGMKDKDGDSYDVLCNNGGQWQRLDRQSGNWV